MQTKTVATQKNTVSAAIIARRANRKPRNHDFGGVMVRGFDEHNTVGVDEFMSWKSQARRDRYDAE